MTSENRSEEANAEPLPENPAPPLPAIPSPLSDTERIALITSLRHTMSEWLSAHDWLNADRMKLGDANNTFLADIDDSIRSFDNVLRNLKEREEEERAPSKAEYIDAFRALGFPKVRLKAPPARDEVRAAFRSRARMWHPDRTRFESGPMTVTYEAWRLLQRFYDSDASTSRPYRGHRS